MVERKRKQIEYRFYDLPFDFPLLLLHGEEWHISDVLSNRMHFHNCFEIGICHTEGGIILCGNESIPFRAGDVSCISRYIPHTTCSTKGSRSHWSYIFLDFDKFLILEDPHCNAYRPAAVPAKPNSMGYGVFSQAQYPRICFLAKEILQELLAKGANHERLIRHMLTLLFYELTREGNAVPNGIGEDKQCFKLRPALEFIKCNYMNQMYVDDLAAMCGLSETHFRRLFTSIVGASPIGFINNIRINQACALLLTEDDTVVSIADRVGFSTISSFNRYFSQVKGVAPRQYRRAGGQKSKHLVDPHAIRQKGWMVPESTPLFPSESNERIE